ncbi:MAG: hypothetical protein JWP91_3001 [Fibrobacteres bacterium]|nr:hypothetical protein [Fibrobacterota bacterium]
MTPSDPIESSLANMARTFEGCVSWAVRAILESEIRIKTPFEAVASVPDGSSLYCILPTASTKYYAQLVVGVEEDDIEILFPGEMDPRVRKDAIGEMANVVSGLFVADDQFIARFGYLRPSTPFFSEGAFTARKDWGLKGRIEANGREMVLHFSIRELQENPAPAPKAADGEASKIEGSPD